MSDIDILKDLLKQRKTSRNPLSIDIIMPNADLELAQLPKANLKGAKLPKANLVEANLERANLKGANLKDAELPFANLYRANLKGADLRGANINGTDFERANLYKAKIDGLDLDGANTEDANFDNPIYEDDTESEEELESEEKINKHFHNVQKTPIPIFRENLHVSIDKLRKTHVMNVMTRDEVSVYTHLTESVENVVFYHSHGNTGTFFITDKNTLEHLCTDTNFVKYKCKSVYKVFIPSPDMYDGATPYLAGKSFGFYGLIPLDQLKTIIESKSPDHQFIVLNKSEIAPSTVALHVLGNNPNVVSASHCQDGQGDTIYRMHRINWKKLPFRGLSKSRSHEKKYKKSISLRNKKSKSKSKSQTKKRPKSV
jgi:hypothetical protein